MPHYSSLFVFFLLSFSLPSFSLPSFSLSSVSFSPASPAPPASPAAGLLRQLGDATAPYISPLYAPPNYASFQTSQQSSFQLHWPTATGAHTVTMDQPKPKRTTNSRVFMWDNATKDWTDALPQDEYSPRHPAFLWKECWEQFNLMKIPILTDDEFYRTAMEIAEDENVTSGEEFKRCFEEEMMLRQAEWKRMSDKVCHQIVRHYEAFPCKDAWRKVEKAYMHRCYMNFMELFKGVALGWEPDALVDIPSDGVTLYDDYYDGYIGHDYDSHIHPDGEPTQIGERSQRKRYILLNLLNG